jgi:hypothetical protein
MALGKLVVCSMGTAVVAYRLLVLSRNVFTAFALRSLPDCFHGPPRFMCLTTVDGAAIHPQWPLTREATVIASFSCVL